jgi:hypothetical protein
MARRLSPHGPAFSRHGPAFSRHGPAFFPAWPGVVRLAVIELAVVGLAGFEPAASATQNCYEPRNRMPALH